MKRLLVFFAALLPLGAQTVLMCGLSRNGTCGLVNLGTGISYDRVSNSLIATPPPAPSPKIQVDTFRVNCSATPAVGCPNGIPQTVFTTSRPVASLVLVLRAIAQSEGLDADYTRTLNPDGTLTITFLTPADTGNVILIYQAQ